MRCHPEEAESHAKRATPDEGPMQLAGSPTNHDEVEVRGAHPFENREGWGSLSRGSAKLGKPPASIKGTQGCSWRNGLIL